MAAAKLEQLVAEPTRLRPRRSGIVDVRAASARKRELRRTMLAVHVAPLAQVGREATPRWLGTWVAASSVLGCRLGAL